MIELNRLSVPGEVAARERVEAVFARIDDLSGLDLANLVVSRRDPEEREVLLADLERAADARGLGELLDEARSTVRDALLARLASDLPAGTYAVRVQETSRVDDRVSLLAAIEDVVAVAVAQDVIERDTAVALSEPGRAILGMDPLDLAGAASPGSEPVGDPPWAPSARDWAEADRGATAIEPGEPMPGERGVRVLLFGGLAVAGATAALAWGFADGEPWLGILVAAAVVAVCWTLATFRRAR